MPEPIAGIDYPRNWTEFDNLFPTDAECLAFLERLRWADGFVCPRCGLVEGWRMTRRNLFLCPGCRKQTSVTAGTIFDRTRTPLRSWFAAIWFVVSQKHGARMSPISSSSRTRATSGSVFAKVRRGCMGRNRGRLRTRSDGGRRQMWVAGHPATRAVERNTT